MQIIISDNQFIFEVSFHILLYITTYSPIYQPVTSATTSRIYNAETCPTNVNPKRTSYSKYTNDPEHHVHVRKTLVLALGILFLLLLFRVTTPGQKRCKNMAKSRYITNGSVRCQFRTGSLPMSMSLASAVGAVLK